MDHSHQLLSTTTKVAHSVVAVGMIGLLAVGIYMSEFEVYGLYDVHKALGVIVFALAVLRVAWRLKKGWPSVVGNASRVQHIAAKAIHWLLIVSTVLYPISGLMMSIGGGHGLSLFGFEAVAETLNPAGETVPLNGFLGDLGHRVHGLITYVVVAAIVIHVAGALKHHVIDKDETINRMFSFK